MLRSTAKIGVTTNLSPYKCFGNTGCCVTHMADYHKVDCLVIYHVLDLRVWGTLSCAASGSINVNGMYDVIAVRTLDDVSLSYFDSL